MKIIVKTMEGLEEVCAAELKNLHLQNIEILNRGVSCEGNWAQLYKCNYLLRSAIRVLLPLKTFNIESQDDYYDAIRSIDWSQYIAKGKTIAVRSTIFGELFTNSLFATYRCKDAIVDQLSEEKEYRPNVNLEHPDIVINVHLNKNELSISLDSSGRSLHLRGYKERSYKAPLNEAFAAGIIMLAGWDQKQAFHDPMCGSGTFTTEALMMAANIPAGKFTEGYSFQKWPEYQKEIWQAVKQAADADISPPECEMYASDINAYAVRDLRKNLQKLPHKDHVLITEEDFLESEGKAGSLLFLNPPYDKRIQVSNVKEFHRKIADTLKAKWKGSAAWVLSGNNQAMKSFGLKHSAKHTLDNGGLPAKLYKFEMYEGSRKTKYQKDN